MGGSLDRAFLVLGAAALHHPAEAFGADSDLTLPGEPYIPTLSLPPMWSYRSDPAFWRAAARKGHLAYWRKRGVWPDFCSDPNAGVDCKAMTAGL